MKISSINFIQNRPGNRVSSPLYRNIGLQPDAVSFTRNTYVNKHKSNMEDLVPKYKGIIYKKITDKNGNIIRKIPVEVDIKKGENSKEFLIIHNDKKVGNISLSYIPRKECINKIEDYDSTEPLYKNYKDYGLVGARLKVEYVENEMSEEYGGIGHLADLLEVACCKELGIKPKVVSFSTLPAAPFHFKRGKRFIPYKQYCSDAQMKAMDLYGKDFNETIREIIKSTEEDEDYDVPSFQDCTFLPLMYMPKEMIRKLQNELKEHPIF